MWIRNLEESASFKQLRGVSAGEFYGGSTTSVGSVTQEDIAALTGKLVEQAYHQKLDVVAKNL